MSGCQCRIEVDIDSYSTTLRRGMHRARKPHICDECMKRIEPGQEYERFVGLSEGNFFTNITCLDCLSVRKNLFCSYYFGRIWETLEEEINESGGEHIAQCLGELTPKARGRVCEMLEKNWAE